MSGNTTEIDLPAWAIEAKGLTKRFLPTIEASVRDLSFSIAQSETLAFLGPNGAGKSTTIKMLCGILSPSSGSAEILGHKAGTKRANQQLGLVFGTRSQLYFHMKVIHCLELSAEIYFLSGEDKRSRIRELAEAFAIDRFLHRRVRTLSLGERMRCEIVAALLHRPRVLLADEPTIGLDIVAKNRLRDLIKNWQRHEKTSLMLTSHDLSDVEALCHRCILIDKGSKRYDGPLKGIKGDLEHLRRIEITTSLADLPLFQDLSRFRLCHSANSFTHVYEIYTHQLSMAEGIFSLTQHYGKYLQDLKVSEVTLEEVLGVHYAAN
ncbi:MAG: ATP-binding cassette domain-containing protein [Bdellovibrionales bacterium]|nr:ATP-binding cassette domain-containing protein [Bdellovibrionales bacterium]